MLTFPSENLCNYLGIRDTFNGSTKGNFMMIGLSSFISNRYKVDKVINPQYMLLRLLAIIFLLGFITNRYNSCFTNSTDLL